jgi:hypothetical protein
LSDVVNLSRFRRKKRAAEKEREASENRAKHGRTKAEKTRDKRVAEELARHVEGHKRENDQE